MNRVALLIALVSFAGAGLGARAETASDWLNNIHLNGDFRYRHDYDSKTSYSTTEARHRERLRLRLGVTAKVNDSATIHTRFAGSDGDDPLTRNNTMDNNGQPKAFYIDEAWVQWNICPDATLDIGKQENVFHDVLPDSHLLFQDDYTPEGFSLLNHFNSVPLFLNLGAYELKVSQPTTNVNAWLMEAMLGYKQDFSNGNGVTVALAYHDFTGLKGHAPLFGADGTNGAYGNTLSGGNYVNNYQVGEALAKYRGKAGNVGYSAYVDAIQNFYLTKNNTGLIAGFKVNPDSWSFGYAYQTIGTDATVSALNDADFADGKDGAIGHIFTIGHPLAKNTSLSLSYRHAKVLEDSGANLGKAYWTDRGYADFNWTF